MPKSRKTPKPSASASNVLPAVMQPSADAQSNQALQAQMTPAASDPISSLLADDAPASAAAPKKKGGLGSFLAKKAGGLMPGSKDKKGAAPARPSTPAPMAAVPSQSQESSESESESESAPRPMTRKEELIAIGYDLQDEIEAEHGPAVDAWMASHGIENTGAQFRQASMYIPMLGSLHDQARNAKPGDRDGDERAADPFAYESDAIDGEVAAALKRAGLTDSELTAVHMYSGVAAYQMNDVLRGKTRDEASVRFFLPWCMHLERALAKLPPTIRNAQVGQKLDASRADGDQIALQKVFRADKWSASFASYFLDNMKVGGKADEPGFFSATSVQSSYGPASPVQREIDVSGSAGRSIIDLSMNKKENEVLFPPGTQMEITGVTDVTDPSAPVQVSDPSAKYDKDEVQERQFAVSARITAAPKADEKPGQAGGGEEQAEAEAALEEADAAKIGALLAESPVKAPI